METIATNTANLTFLDNPEVSDSVYYSDISQYYHLCLKRSEDAQGYLQSRGLTDPELIERYHLGFGDRTLGKLIPDKQTKKGAAIRTRLISLGIFRQTGQEAYRGSVVMPVFDELGQVTNLYGRKIESNLRKETPIHNYASKDFRGVWNIEAVKISKEVILADSPINAMVLWCRGFRNVTCTFHGSGITADLLDALTRYGVEKVLIAWKRTLSDTSSVIERVKPITDAGIPVYRVMFPVDEDAADFASGVSPEMVARVLNKAEWLAGEARAVECTTGSEGDSGATSGAVGGDIRGTDSDDSTPTITIGDRTYKARGMERNLIPGTLKVTLSVMRDGSLFMDQLNLCSAKQRASFVRQAAEEIGLDEDSIRYDLSKVLVKLETLQDEIIRTTFKPHQQQPVAVAEADKVEALTLLRDPDLLERIVADYQRSGLVGERTNVLTAYLGATSRLLDNPLAITIQSSSAAGKTSLLNAILHFFPAEDVVTFSALSPQVLFYFADGQLKRKILAVAEEEGIQRSSYALKLLVSEGHLKIATTGKEETTGRTVAEFYVVEGPTALFMTTTSPDLDEELQNRTLLLTVDESRDQTKAIHEVQRRNQTIEGLLAKKERDAIFRVHQNAQRLLRSLPVVNNFADQLSFLDSATRLRRDHVKYLNLIQAVALLRQYQKEIKSIEHKGSTIEYIEADPRDIEIANQLAHEVLGRTLDELPPQSRRLLHLLHEMAASECDKEGIDLSDFQFTRRRIREYTGWSYGQVRIHLQKLIDMEHVAVCSGSKGQRFRYELTGEQGTDSTKRFLSGLMDSKRLKPVIPA